MEQHLWRRRRRRTTTGRETEAGLRGLRRGSESLVMRWLVLVVVVVVVVSGQVGWLGTGLVGVAEAQGCSGDLSGVPSECRPFITRSFFVPGALAANKTAGTEPIERKDLNRLATINALSLSPVENHCRIPALRYACGTIYQPCTLHPISPSLPNFLVFPLPKSPCRSVCESMVEACKGVLPDETLPDCDSVSSATGEPENPRRATKYEVNGETYEVPCNEKPLNTTPGRTTECPAPTKLRDRGRADPPCQVPCPAPYYTDGEWLGQFLVLYIGAPISVAGAAWVLICWLAQARLRKFPAHLPMFPATAALLVGLTWMVGNIIGPENMICENAWKPHGPGGVCGAQAFLLQIALLVHIFYFFWICFTLYLLIVREAQVSELRWYPWVVHVTGVGLPIVLSIIGYANQIALPTVGYCFPATSPEWAFPLIYGWVGGFLIINFFLALAVLVKLNFVSMVATKKFRLNWRHAGMMTFVFIFFFVLTWGFAFNVYVIPVDRDTPKALEEQVICNAQLKEHCPLRQRPLYWFTTLTEILWLLAGFWNLIAFANRKTLHVTALLFLREVFLRGNFRLLKTGLSDATIASAGLRTSTRTSKRPNTTSTGTGGASKSKASKDSGTTSTDASTTPSSNR